MSYTIERGKQVLHVVAPEDDERFRPFHHLFLWVLEGASNNVHPRSYSKDLIDLSANSGPVHEWNGTPLMPGRIWAMGEDADGGCLKPWGKDQEGIAYLKSWKRKAAAPESVEGDNPWAWPFRPHLSIWAGSNPDSDEHLPKHLLQADITSGFARCYDFQREAVIASFRRLFPEPEVFRYDNARASISCQADLLDALHLWRQRQRLGFSVYLCEDTGKEGAPRRLAAPKPLRLPAPAVKPIAIAASGPSLAAARLALL